MSYLKLVAAFHMLFGAPVLPKPTIPSKKRCDLRVSLIQEELNELKEAIDKGDMVEIADALADLQYVLSGSVLEFGLGEKFDTIFNAVHESNMSKATYSSDVAEATVRHYKNKGQDCRFVEKDYFDDFGMHTHTIYIVLRNEDNKVLKSIEYKPVDIKPLLED